MLLYLNEESAEGLKEILEDVIKQLNEGLKDYKGSKYAQEK